MTALLIVPVDRHRRREREVDHRFDRPTGGWSYRGKDLGRFRHGDNVLVIVDASPDAIAGHDGAPTSRLGHRHRGSCGYPGSLDESGRQVQDLGDAPPPVESNPREGNQTQQDKRPTPVAAVPNSPAAGIRQR